MPVGPNMPRAKALWLATTIALAPGAAACDDAVTVPLAALFRRGGGVGVRRDRLAAGVAAAGHRFRRPRRADRAAPGRSGREKHRAEPGSAVARSHRTLR